MVASHKRKSLSLKDMFEGRYQFEARQDEKNA
ncbi:hypothetical protein VCR4J2_100057 [Vibrio coralliirubri]|nr:hypothetical protein VCR4J2_100057 [Vibrio coralliirubri]